MAEPTDKQPAGATVEGDPYADAPRTVGGRTARLARPEGLDDDAMRAGLKMNAPRDDKNVTGTLKGHPAPKEIAVARSESPMDDASSDAELDDDPGVVRDEPINFADIFVDRPPTEGSSEAASGPVPKREPVELPREKVAIKGGASEKDTGHRSSDEVEDVLVQLPSGSSPTDVTMLSVSVKDKQPSPPSRGVWVAVLGGAALAGLLVWWALRTGPAPVGENGMATPPKSPPAAAPAAEAERGDDSAEAPRENPPEAAGAETSDTSPAPASSAAPASPESSAEVLPPSAPPSTATPRPPSPRPPPTTEPKPAPSDRIF